MPAVDYEWVRQQMQAAQIRVIEGDAVLALFRAWEKMSVPEAQQVNALKLFARLASGDPLTEGNQEEVWVDAQPGQIVVSDEVRVKADSYHGELGEIHNGRRGKVVAIRSGDIVVKTTDGKKPTLDGANYSPHQLEKRIK